MADFQPPPSYELPIQIEERTDMMGQKRSVAKFSPIWLKWFLDLTKVLSSAGGSAGSIDHNSTTGKQGGAGAEFYHLTAAEYAALAAGSASGVLAGRAFRQFQLAAPMLSGDIEAVLAARVFAQPPPQVEYGNGQGILVNQVFGG